MLFHQPAFWESRENEEDLSTETFVTPIRGSPCETGSGKLRRNEMAITDGNTGLNSLEAAWRIRTVKMDESIPLLHSRTSPYCLSD